MSKLSTGVAALALAALACTDGSTLKRGQGTGGSGQAGSSSSNGGQSTQGSVGGGAGGKDDCICDFVAGGMTGSAGATGTPGGNAGSTPSSGGAVGGGAAGTTGGSTSSTGGTGGSSGTSANKCTQEQNTCTTDDDCILSSYQPPISSSADCSCFLCGYASTKAIAGDCQSAYNQFCGPNWQTEHHCMPPPCPVFLGFVCVDGRCQ